MQANAILMLAGTLVWSIAGIRVLTVLSREGASAAALADLTAWLVFMAVVLHQGGREMKARKTK